MVAEELVVAPAPTRKELPWFTDRLNRNQDSLKATVSQTVDLFADATAYLFEQADSLRIYPAGLSKAEIKKIKTAEKQAGKDIRASFRLKNKDGSINWSALGKWGIYTGSAFILFGCGVALSHQLNGDSGNSGNNNDNDNALCANLLNAAEKLNTDNHLFVSVSALDAAGAQSPDLGPLQDELRQCYSPDLSVSSGVPVFDANSEFPAQVFQLNHTGAGGVEPFLGIEVPNGKVEIDTNADGRPDFSASRVSLFNLDQTHVVFKVDKYGTLTGTLSGVAFDIDTKQFEPTGETAVFEMSGSGDGAQMKITVDGGGQETRIVLDKAGIEAMFGVQKLAELTGDKQTEMAEFNRQARFEGDDPQFLVGGGESPGRPVSLPQDVLAFLRNNHEGPIINGDNFIARVSADGVCSVFTTDHLVDSGAVLSEVNDGRVVFSVNGTATVGQFRFPVPDGVACVASLAQEGSGFEPGTTLVRFFRDNGKAGAQVLNEEPIRPLVNAPNRIELVRLESGFQLITTGADGQEIETQTVDTKDWVPTAELEATALFNEYGVDPNTYTLAEVGGVMVGTDNETGKEIFRDGRFELGYAVELAKKDCEPTNFAPQEGGGLVKQEHSEALSNYESTMINDPDYNPPGDTFYVVYVLVDREKQCWGFGDGDSLVYRNLTGSLQIVPTIHLTEDEVFTFIFNR